MQAVLLTGGLGTRLRPLTFTKAKCLLPVLNRPLIDHAMASLPKAVKEVFVTLNAAHLFPEGDFEKRHPDRKLSFLREDEGLGTGGPVRFLSDSLRKDFLVINGDVLSSLDVGAMMRFHQKRGGLGTIALFEAEDPRPYGVVELGKDGRLSRFEEKPEVPFSNLINAGAYVLSADIFDHFPDARSFSIEREVFAKVAGELNGFPFEGYWLDCGTPASFLEANRILLSMKGGSSRGGLEGVDLREPVDVAEAQVRDGVLGPNAVVGKGCFLNSAQVSDSVLFERVSVGSYSAIIGSIVGDNCRIGRNCHIERSVLGDGVDLRDGERLVDKKLPRVA